MKITREEKIRTQESIKRAEGASAMSTVTPHEPGVLTIELRLVGRICLVESNGELYALFLNAQHNPALNFPKHNPVLCAAEEDATQEGSDHAHLSLMNPTGRAQVIWDVNGCDLGFEGLASTNQPAATTARLPDLRSAYKKIDARATWKTRAQLIDSQDPRREGIVARLSLRGFDQVDSMFFDETGELIGGDVARPAFSRTFIPGDFTQNSDVVIRCRGRFRSIETSKPTLVRRAFGGGEPQRIPFDDTKAFALAFSNLCNCAGTDESQAPPLKKGGETLVLEDKEFAVFYELLADPPPEEQRPLPFVPEGGAAGGRVVACVPTAMLPL